MPSDTSTNTVHTLAPGDVGGLQALMALFADAFEDPATYAAAPPDDAHLRRLLDSDTFVAIVARDAATGAVVGGLTAYDLVKPERATSELYIYDLAVAASHRRRGIATACIDRLRAIARARGAWVVYVQADLADAPAIALYTTLGTREDVLHFDIEP
jgi:aminoglycoside 3-N-acetyltransferase I